MSVGKMGLLVCDGCALPLKTEHIRITHRFFEQATETEMDFCCAECLADYLYDEVHSDRIQKEVDSLRTMLCPDCWTKTA